MHTDHGKTYEVKRDRNGRRKYFTRAAEDCNVTPGHLRRVLAGVRTSAALMERVQRLHPELLAL